MKIHYHTCKKHISIFIFMLILTVVIFSNCSNNADESSDLYVSNEYGFSILHPADWETVEELSAAENYDPGSNVYIAGFFSPKTAIQDFQENFTITLIIPNDDESLIDVVNSSIEILQENKYEYEFIESKPIENHDFPAHFFAYYSEGVNTKNISWHQLIDPQHDEIDGFFNLTFTADAQSFPEYRETAQKMFDSFALTN